MVMKKTGFDGGAEAPALSKTAGMSGAGLRAGAAAALKMIPAQTVCSPKHKAGRLFVSDASLVGAVSLRAARVALNGGGNSAFQGM